jgi:gelsolin
MTEDIFILDCHSEIFVWVGQNVDSKSRVHALTIGEVRLIWLLFEEILLS